MAETQLGFNMKRTSITYLLLLLFWLSPFALFAEDGYKAWLRYEKVSNEQLLESYRDQIKSVFINGDSPTLQAIHRELEKGLGGLLASEVHFNSEIHDGSLLVGTHDELSSFFGSELEPLLQNINPEGYVIKSLQIDGEGVTVITGNTEIGVLYGTYSFLRMLQTHESISDLEIADSPKIENRILNHWDNLNRLVERGYAGLSLWDWGTLPDYQDPR